MEEGWIELAENFTVEVVPSVKGSAKYIFRNHSTEILVLDKQKQPKELTNQSNVARRIKEVMNPKNRLTKEAIEEDWEIIRQILQEQYESIILAEEQLVRETEAESESERKKNISEAKTVFSNIENPLIYVASLIDWFTASERRNILISFLAYASQIVLKNPISVIALGDASSGKSHILEVALSLIPSEYIVYEKKVTEAVIFNRAKEDEYFYDGKIVFYGDMGGDNDHEDAENCKALMKELQSDGHLDKPLNIPSKEGGWEVKDLHLKGRPSLSYTTIPNYSFDEQEKSRSIFITPKMDNKVAFNKRCKYLEFQGKTKKQVDEYSEIASLIPYLLYYLQEKLEDVKIINPFVNSIHMFLGNSKFYKRDFPKYNGLLKTITALNSINREVINFNDEKFLFVSKEDVALFLSLFETYRDSINCNLSPKSSEILIDLRNNLPKWLKSDIGEIKVGITVNEYIELSNIDINKRSVQRYFSELNENGFLNVVGSDGRKNVWNVTENYSSEEVMVATKLSDEDLSLIIDELGDEVLEYIDSDDTVVEYDIMTQHEKVMKPKW